jgi:acetyl-CoA synthetase
MTFKAIRKSSDKLAPNLDDYERFCREFSCEAARGELDGLPEGRGLNIAHEAVDRHGVAIATEQKFTIFA